MDEGYWALFCATGNPLFYLLFCEERGREEQERALTAWADRKAELL